MQELETSLIQMGKRAPELRENLRPIIAHLRTAATMNVRDKWADIIWKNEKAEEKQMEALLKSMVPYLKSVGLDLDVRTSWLGKEHHGSDGNRLAGTLVLRDRKENTVPTDTARKVSEWLEQATGLYGTARPHSSGAWIVDVTEY